MTDAPTVVVGSPPAPPFDGRPFRVHLLARPGLRSLSPAMMNRAFATYGWPGTYSLLEVASPELAKTCAALLRLPEVRGANVTMPHKRDVYELVARRTERARAAGTVNTLRREGSDWQGENTDTDGFLLPLLARGLRLEGSTAFVLGGGGAARAVALGLAEAGVSRLLVINRTPDRVEAWLDALPRRCHPGLFPLSKLNALRNARPGLLVSAIPTEACPGSLALSTRPRAVFDLAYVAEPSPEAATPLSREAAAAGLVSIDGREMLLAQGVLSFRYWFGVEPPTGAMSEAIGLPLAPTLPPPC